MRNLDIIRDIYLWTLNILFGCEYDTGTRKESSTLTIPSTPEQNGVVRESAIESFH